MRNMRKVAAAATALLVALTGCQSGGTDTAQTGEAPKAGGSLKGKTIELIVPFDPGGGYDQYARALAGPLGEALSANVIVVNKPGAGGLLANNALNNARPDGTTIEILNMTGTLGSALAGAKGVQYEPAEFSYLGQVTTEPAIMVVNSKSPYDTFEELVESTPEIRFAATGPGSNEYIDPVVVTGILGLKNKIVTGFKGSGESALALIQGNVDAYSRAFSSQFPIIKSGEAKPVLVLGSERVDEFPDVPTVLELEMNEKQEKLMQNHVSLIESGRTLAGPPGMDEAVLAELRAAFTKVVQDPQFVEDSEAAGRPIVYKSGEEVQEDVRELMNAPKEYVDLLKSAFAK